MELAAQLRDLTLLSLELLEHLGRLRGAAPAATADEVDPIVQSPPPGGERPLLVLQALEGVAVAGVRIGFHGTDIGSDTVPL